jgi:hypothetical protein
MRAAAAALALGLLLVGAGCGAGTAATTNAGVDAAALVPPSALAFVSADANLESSEWQVVGDLVGGLKYLTQGLDYQRDIQPALGDQLNLAVLGIDNGKPEAIALVHSPDESKLQALAAKFDQGKEHYTVERIAGWSVVADSQEAFDAVRRAEAGTSLGDTAEFKSAMKQVGDGGLATAYANVSVFHQSHGALSALTRLLGSPRWVAARLSAEKHAVQLDLRADSSGRAPAVHKPTLLRDVPSGAIAAVSFRDFDRLLARVAAEPSLRGALHQVETALGTRVADLRSLSGEGVLSIAPGPLIPVVTLEVQPRDPAAALRTLKAVAARRAQGLAFRVERQGPKVVLTNAAAGARPSGAALVDDQPFKDALAAADVPAEVTWLAYADVQRLLPIVQAIAALTGGGNGQAKTSPTLAKLGTVVAYGAGSRIALRVTLR